MKQQIKISFRVFGFKESGAIILILVVIKSIRKFSSKNWIEVDAH
jgi:hypothetical protein